jgi:4-amino-4-deoxy-L-arabinose transferase-like glycosyltransferase
MPNHKIPENWHWLSLWFVLIASAIYSRPLIPIDETRYLSVAWEMWSSHNFLVPHINGEPYSHKPPLLFWLIHLVWFVFGVSETSGRLVGPIFGFGSIMLTVHLAKMLWPTEKDVRYAVPFILLGTFVWSLYSSLTMFDTLLTFFVLSALISILQASKNQSNWPWVCLSLSIGLGILAKGPIVFLYIVPPLVLVKLWSTTNTFSLKWWCGCSLVSIFAGVVMGLCWAIPAAMAGGEEYKQAILFSQTAGRMVKAFAHSRPFYWYFLLTPLLFTPWFFWLPLWRRKNKSFDYAMTFCVCAIFPALFLLSLVSGKQIHYVLPILPTCSLLIARAVTGAAQRSVFDRIPLLVFLFAFSLILLVVPQMSLEGGDREMLKYIPKWLSLVPALCGVILLFLKSKSAIGNVKIVSSVMVMLLVLLHLTIATPLHGIYDQSVIGKQLKKAQKEQRRIAVYPANLSDQFQFSGRLTEPLIPHKTLDSLATWALAHPNQYSLVFTEDSQYVTLQGNGLARPYKDGWLLYNSNRDFYARYEIWINRKNDIQKPSQKIATIENHDTIISKYTVSSNE